MIKTILKHLIIAFGFSHKRWVDFRFLIYVVELITDASSKQYIQDKRKLNLGVYFKYLYLLRCRCFLTGSVKLTQLTACSVIVNTSIERDSYICYQNLSFSYSTMRSTWLNKLCIFIRAKLVAQFLHLFLSLFFHRIKFIRELLWTPVLMSKATAHYSS